MTFNEANKKGLVRTKTGNYKLLNESGRKIYKEAICYFCKETHLQRSDNLKPINFCSISCRSKYFRGDKAPGWNGGKVKHECQVCKKAFYTCNAQSDRKCCSRQCAGKLRRLSVINDTEKFCTKCQKWKDHNDFGFRKSDQFGLARFCKECERKRATIYNASEAGRQSKIRYAQSEHGKQKLSEYIISGRRNQTLKRYRVTESYKLIRKRSNQKVCGNPETKLNNSMRVGIRRSLKGRKNGRHWEAFVDFNVIDLIAHLESQFQSGMTWNNYGKAGWEIDHDIPLSYFNFNNHKDQEFKDAWALSNLQPMWAKENISKRNRYIGNFRGFV